MLHSPVQQLCIKYQHENWHRKKLFDMQLHNDIYDYEKDCCGFIHLHSPQRGIMAELRNCINVPDMLVVKIIILIQSLLQRHFLLGSRLKAH